MQTHFGDPCIHCGLPLDDVEIGACNGDPGKAIIITYCIDRQAYDNPGSGCQTVLCAFSTGKVRQEAHYPSERFSYGSRFEKAQAMPRDAFRNLYKVTFP